MQILPIINTINNYKIYQSQPLQTSIRAGENLKPLACDTVSFGHCPGDKALKQLLAYGIPDIYTGKIMIPFEELQYLMERKTFSLPLKKLVKVLTKYEDCFQDIPAEIFKILKKQAKISPRDRLDSVIHRLVPEHNEKLVKIQRPIFDKLADMSKKMPKEQLMKFEKLMRVTESQIRNEEIAKPFDALDFRYKLQRIAIRNKSKNGYHEHFIMKKLKSLACQLPVEGENSDFCYRLENPKGKVKKKKYNLNKRDRQAQSTAIISKMSKILDSSSLANDKELKQLLYMAKMQLYDVKLVCPFQRKTFIMQLSEIVNELNDKHLAHRMIQCAIKLPNSAENVSAFIVKSAESSAEKILYDLLYPSVGTIEHLKPSKSGGKDNLYNYALASALVNSQRAHMSFAVWLRKHPKTYKNCQKYVDRLIELCHNGVFKEVKLSKDYIVHFVNLVKRMSPEEKPLILDYSGLKKKVIKHNS